jgi:hypothetical protein
MMKSQVYLAEVDHLLHSKSERMKSVLTGLSGFLLKLDG